MKTSPAILRWISLILAVLAVGVAGWQGWIRLAAECGGRLLSQPVPMWAMIAFAFLVLAVVVWFRGRSLRPEMPRETIRIVPQPRGHRWHMGSVASRPAMQVVSEWFITNITDKPVRLLGAHIAPPSTNGFVLVRHPERNVFGSYEIPPGFTTQATADFWVQPPVRKVGQDFKATVVIVDQFGNRHTVRNVLFRGERAPAPQQAELPQEPIHAIADPVEKQAVAVLKDEVNRYRLVGTLGRNDLPEACSRYVYTRGREAFDQFVKVQLNTDGVQPSTVHHRLLNLDPGEILTTNPEDTKRLLARFDYLPTQDDRENAFELARQVASGTWVLFGGAGVSASCGLPSGAELVERLCVKIKVPGRVKSP